MQGIKFTQNLMAIMNVVKNTFEGKDDVLEIDPDVMHSGKITRLLSKFLISPNIILDENLRYMDKKVVKDLIKTEMMLFTSIVTEGIRILTELYGMDPVSAIKTINRGRGYESVINDVKRITDLATGGENIDYVNDVFLNKDGFLPLGGNNEIKVSGEASSNSRGSTLSNNAFIQKDNSSFVNVYELQLKIDDKEGKERVIVIPIVIYPNIHYENMNTFIENMIDEKDNKTFFSRWMEYRSGGISLYNFLVADDIVKKYKDKKLKNTSYFSNYLNMVDKSTFVRDVLHNKLSFSKNFNIYIFDNSFQQVLERKIKGSILESKYKQTVIDQLMAFTISFVDTEEEEVTILVDDLPGFSVLDFNMLKKVKEADINDVVKSLLNNRQPF